MNAVSQMMLVNMILQEIKISCLDKVSPILVADLASYAQTILYGSDDEANSAWSDAQSMMRRCAAIRIEIAVQRGLDEKR